MTTERQLIPPGLGFPEPDHPVWQMANLFPPNEFGERAWVAYERELPGLLEASLGQWVAYHGDKRLGIGPLHTRLYDECVGRGLSPDELVICRIEPHSDEMIHLGGAWMRELQ